MSEQISHTLFVELTRDQGEITTQAILGVEISYLVGARKQDSSRHDVEVAEGDSDFRAYVIIASETDDYPLGLVREILDSTSLAKRQPEIDAAESWAKQYRE